MALEYTLNSAGGIKTVFEGACEQAVETEINLPDYCADILRILKCTVTPCVVSSKITGDRACADGNLLMRIVYCDEEDNICSVEQTVPFSKMIEKGADIDGTLFVTPKTEYVNCRAVSRRKAEIRGNVRFVFKICRVLPAEFIDNIETQGIESRGGEIQFSSVTACECKQFPISETAEIPRDYLPAQRIVHTCAVPILNEAKIIKGKLLLKGEISVGIIYCADKNKGECTQFDYSIPVSQVTDVPGASEEGFADVCLRVISCDISAREDSDGEQRFFDINLVVCARINTYINKNSAYISDAYSTSGELAAEYETVEFYNHSQNINDTFTCREAFDFSAVSAQKILAVWFGEPEFRSDGEIKSIKGKVPVNFILSDSDGKPVFCERELDFDYGFKNSVCIPGIPSVSVSGHSCSPLSAGSAEVKAELIIIADTFTVSERRALVLAELGEETVKTDRAGIVVYFPDEDEKLWDIARKYGSTQQAIQKENGISGDELDAGKPIVIPCL